MTRPLDVFFVSHSRQNWSGSQDESLEQTCAWLAGRWFGKANEASIGHYLAAMSRDMPRFGRETSDFFIDQPIEELAPVEQTLAGCHERLAMLAKADTEAMTVAQRNRHTYYVQYESFVSDLFETQSKYDQALAAQNADHTQKAAQLLAQCHPETIVERYAHMASLQGITRGEQGLIFTINTRWLNHYVRLRQQLRQEPVRYNFAATQHEKLAQAAGKLTFYFDRQKQLWQVLGQAETGANVFSLRERLPVISSAAAAIAEPEVFQTGIQSNDPIKLTLRPIMPKGSRPGLKPVPLAAGNYQLAILMVEPTATATGEQILDVSLKGRSLKQSISDRVDLFDRAGGTNRAFALKYSLELLQPGTIELTLKPVRGRAFLCGAVLTPD